MLSLTTDLLDQKAIHFKRFDHSSIRKSYRNETLTHYTIHFHLGVYFIDVT
jgi:hypothetical protein